MRVCNSWRISVTSRSWMWRRSSRRCSVMLSAPDCSASKRRMNGIRIIDAPCLTQRRDVIDVDPQRDAAGHAGRGGGHGARRRIASITSRDFSARPSRQASRAARKHTLCVLERARVRERLRLEIGQRSAVDRARSVRHARLRAALRLKPVITVDDDRISVRGAGQLQSVPEVVQQPLLEAPQMLLLAPAAAQRLHAGGVRGEDLRMRITALGQLQDELVQVEPAHQAVVRQRGRGAVDLRAHELAGLAPARPGDEQPLKRAQHRLEGGFAPVRAARKQRQPALFVGRRPPRFGWCRDRRIDGERRRARARRGARTDGKAPA